MKNKLYILKLLFFIAFSLTFSCSRTQPPVEKSDLCEMNFSQLLEVLDREVAQEQVYRQQFEEAIAFKRQQLSLATTPVEKLELSLALQADYSLFQSDSSLYYLNQAQNILHQDSKDHADDARRIAQNEMQYSLLECERASIYGHAGLPSIGAHLLDSIVGATRNEEILKVAYQTYFDVYDFYYAYLLPSNLRDKGMKFLSMIQDSLTKYEENRIETLVRVEINTESKDSQIEGLRKKLKETDDNGYKGVCAICIANKYKKIANDSERNRYWAISAIYNLRACRMDNEGLLDLAGLMLQEKQYDRALNYLECSYRQANFYKGRSRILEMSPLLYDHIKRYVAVRKAMTWALLVGGIVFVLILSLFGFYLFRKRKQYSSAIKKYDELETQWNVLNKELNHDREALETQSEALSQFLSICIDFLLDFGLLRQTVANKIMANDTKGAINILKRNSHSSINQQKLMKRFDIVFNRLYPNFRNQVNDLLRPEEAIKAPDSEILNNELRLLALMKLGISDSQRIATILDVSVNTIYFYRNRLKNKAKTRELFEEQVIHIENTPIT